MPTGLMADTVGPVDVAVLSFEGDQFNGDVAPALLELQRNGTVRVLDATFVRKDGDGSVAVVEVSDSGVAGAFESLTEAEFDLLSDHDLEAVAAALEPDSSALVLVWENTWAGRVAAAIRGSNGRLAYLERIPRAEVVAAIAALDEG